MTKPNEILEALYYAGYDCMKSLIYPGQLKDLPKDILKMLDGIQVEDLAILRTLSFWDFSPDVWKQNPFEGMEHDTTSAIPTEAEIHEICRRLYEGMKSGKAFGSPIHGEPIFPIIKKNLFSVRNGQRKISPSLYASEDEVNIWLYPIQSTLNEIRNCPTIKPYTNEWNRASHIESIVRLYNPYFKALKTSEFGNRPLDDLCSILYDFMSLQYGLKPGEHFKLSSEAWGKEIIENLPLLYPCTKKDFQPLFEFARKKFGVGQYHFLPQGRDINKIITSIGAVEDEATQLDLFRTAAIPIDKDFTLYVENYEKPLSPAARKTLDILLIEYQRQGSTGTVEMTLKEFMDYMGYTDKDYAKAVIQKVLNGKELSNIGFEVREKGKPSGRIRLCGGTSAYIRGKIHWNFNVDFLPILQGSFIAEMPREYLQTNDKRHPNSYYLYRAIWIDWRMNEGKRRRLSIKSLIDKCPPLKKNLDSKKKGEYIQSRFIDDLDAIENIFVDYVDEKGNVIDDPAGLPFKDFYKSYIMVDQSDFPNHPDRLKHAATRRKQLQSAIDKAKAKAIVNKENP